MRHTLAFERVNDTRAQAHAIAMNLAGKDSGVTTMTKAELEEAYLL